MPPARNAKGEVGKKKDILDGERVVLYLMTSNYYRMFLFAVTSKRPKRTNQGRGGAVAQLQAISEQITDTGRQKKRKDIPLDIPANAMAPVSRKTVRWSSKCF